MHVEKQSKGQVTKPAIIPPIRDAYLSIDLELFLEYYFI